MQVQKTVAADYMTASKVCKTRNLVVQDGFVLEGLDSSQPLTGSKDSDAIRTLRKLLAMHNAFKHVYNTMSTTNYTPDVVNLMGALIGDENNQSEEQKAFEESLKP